MEAPFQQSDLKQRLVQDESRTRPSECHVEQVEFLRDKSRTGVPGEQPEAVGVVVAEGHLLPLEALDLSPYV